MNDFPFPSAKIRPTPFPIIGNLLKLGDQPHKSLTDLAKIYGPIISLKLGTTTTVVISSSTTAKEILRKQDLAFSSRSVPDDLHAHDQFKYSVIWLPVSTQWRSIRKILNSHIFSISRLDANQHLRSKKVEELILYCQNSSELGDPVDIGQAGFRTLLNLLSNTIFSTDLTDPFKDSAKEFRELVWNIMAEAGKPNLVDYFPLLKGIDLQGIRRRMTVYFGEVFHLFGEMTKKRLELRKLHETVENNDVLDVCLNISQENPNEIDRTHMEHMFLDLFSAGTDTTSSTLEWALAELLRNPEIMLKAKSELNEVIGKGKILKEVDVTRLPYMVETDVEACAYIVPKGAQVLLSAWAIGRDPRLWEDPLSFKPERFLGSKIDVRGQDFELIPFAAGRRICPGLLLAIRMVPVMLGSMINLFD
ncbi:hypothetical protein LguiB_009180 [Lonicera macranthoides]